MGNGQGREGFRTTSNGVIRLLAEIVAPFTQGGLEPGEGLERARDGGTEGERQRGRDGERENGREREREWKRGLSFG